MHVFMRQTFGKTIFFIFFTSVFLIFALRITRPAETNNPLIGVNAQQLRWNYSGGEFLGLPDHPPFQQDLQSPISAHPWPNNTTCSRFETRLGVDIPRVYLVSFPRSGNTWTRYLVEGATGIFTGSVYVDQKLYNLGYLGEKQNITSNTTLLIKDHLFGGKPAPRDGPIILIIRDPRNAIASFLAFKKARKIHENPHLYNGPETLQIEDFEKDLENYIDSWERVATKAMTSPTVLVLRYEDIKADSIRSVRKILAFLNIRPDEDRLACLSIHVQGKVNRGQPELDIYTAEQELIFSAAVARVSRLMESKGLPPLPYNS